MRRKSEFNLINNETIIYIHPFILIIFRVLDMYTWWLFDVNRKSLFSRFSKNMKNKWTSRENIVLKGGRTRFQGRKRTRRFYQQQQGWWWCKEEVKGKRDYRGLAYNLTFADNPCKENAYFHYHNLLFIPIMNFVRLIFWFAKIFR